MDDIIVVQIVEGLTNLVDDILLVFFLQDVASPNQSMQIHVHVLENQVDIDIVIGSENAL